MSWSIWIRVFVLVVASGWIAWLHACRPPTCTPTGAETCDGVDNDCDGFVDEDTVAPQSTADEAVSGQVHFIEVVGNDFLVGGLDEGDGWVTRFSSGGGNATSIVGLTSQPVGGDLRAAVSGNRAVVSRVDEGANTVHLALLNINGGSGQTPTVCVSLDDVVEQYTTQQDPRAAVPVFDPVTGEVVLFVYVEGSIRALRFAVPGGCAVPSTTWASPVSDTLVIEDMSGDLGLDYAVDFPTSGGADPVLAYYKRNSALLKNTLRVATLPRQTLQVDESEAVEIIGSTEGTVNPDLAFGPGDTAALVYTNVTSDPGGGPSIRMATLHRFHASTLACVEDPAASLETCPQAITSTTADPPSVAYRNNQTWVVGHVTPLQGWGVAIVDAINVRYYGQALETNNDPAATHVAVNDLGTALASKSDMQGTSLVRPMSIDATCSGVVHMGGSGYDFGKGVTDASGNTIVAGEFASVATFGEGSAEITLTSAGQSDVFVAKYSPTGVLLWATAAGGSSYDKSTGAAVDTTGDVFVTGEFRSTATFGEGASATTLTSMGAIDAFVAKYDSSGNLIWVQQIQASSSAVGRTIQIDPAGRVVVGGGFFGSATFGGGSSAVTLTASVMDAFIAMYDTNGSLLWAKDSDGSGQEFLADLAVDGAGNIVVGGWFDGTSATFGDGADAVTLSNSNASDVFIAKYGPTGSLLWAKKAGGTGLEQGYGVTFQSDGSAVLAGWFMQWATFGEGANATTLISTGAQDLFVAKYASDGALVWVEQIRSPSSNFSVYVGSGPDGGVVATGGFGLDTTFGTGADSVILTAEGSGDMFVASYDSSGDLVYDSQDELWVQQAGAAGGNTTGYSLGADPDDNLVITGGFYTATSLGDGAAEVQLSSDGQRDVFVVKYTPGGAVRGHW